MVDLMSYVLFIMGCSFVILSLYSLTKNRSRVSVYFALMCFTFSIYIIGYSFELRAESIEQLLFFLKIEYFGIPFMGLFWFLFAYEFTYNKNPLLKFICFLLVIPVFTLFMNVTNEYHHLFYKELFVKLQDKYLIASFTKGLFYYINVLYSFILTMLGLYIFYQSWRNYLYTMKVQTQLMFIGAHIPIIFGIITFLEMIPNIDLFPFGLSILSVFYFIALFKFDFLDLNENIRTLIFSEISEGIIVIDDKGRLIDYNKAAYATFAGLNKRNIGKSICEIETINELVHNNEKNFEITVEKPKKFYDIRVTTLHIKNKLIGRVYFIRDITKEKHMINLLNDMASIDVLTQVYNRRRLMEEADKEYLRMKRYHNALSILMIDIDDFKIINDTYGHQIGDEVLRAVANICKKRIRSTDIIGRYGGEEFLILLPESTLKDAFKVAEELRFTVEMMEVEVNSLRLKTTISIGISSIENNTNINNIMEAINNADMALYNSKGEGKNRVSISY